MRSWWERLVGAYSVAELPFVGRFALDPGRVLEVSGADRLGDLSPRTAVDFPHLADLTVASFTDPDDPLGAALGRELRAALERRQWLWLGAVPPARVPELVRLFGEGVVAVVGEPHGGRTPVALNPCRWVRTWAHGTDEQRAFLRRATEGTDALTISRHDLAALRAAGARVIERSALARFLRSPKVIAYLVVLVYSALRALPVMFVQQFHGKVWILWAIDLTTAIPYTWGIIAMVAARRWWVRAAGVFVALTTFVAPYVYFWANGRSYPWYVVVIVVGMIVAAFALEAGRIARDRLVDRRLREAPAPAGEVA